MSRRILCDRGMLDRPVVTPPQDSSFTWDSANRQHRRELLALVRYHLRRLAPFHTKESLQGTFVFEFKGERHFHSRIHRARHGTFDLPYLSFRHRALVLTFAEKILFAKCPHLVELHDVMFVLVVVLDDESSANGMKRISDHVLATGALNRCGGSMKAADDTRIIFLTQAFAQRADVFDASLVDLVLHMLDAKTVIDSPKLIRARFDIMIRDVAAKVNVCVRSCDDLRYKGCQCLMTPCLALAAAAATLLLVLARRALVK